MDPPEEIHGSSQSRTSPVTPVPAPYTLKHLVFIYETALNFVAWIKKTYGNLKRDPFKNIDDFVKKVFGPRYNVFKDFLYGVLETLDKMVDSVLNSAAKLWFWFVVALLLPVSLQFWIIKTGFRLAIQYNLTVIELKINGFPLAKFIPFIPVMQIANALKGSLRAIIKYLDFPFENFKNEFLVFETKRNQYEASKKETKEQES